MGPFPSPRKPKAAGTPQRCHCPRERDRRCWGPQPPFSHPLQVSLGAWSLRAQEEGQASACHPQGTAMTSHLAGASNHRSVGWYEGAPGGSMTMATHWEFLLFKEL